MNKIGFTRAITKHQQREWLLHKIREENHALAKADEGALDPSTASTEWPSLHFVDQEPLPNCPPDAHYQMSQGKKFHWELSAWLLRNKKDKAVEVGRLHSHRSVGLTCDTGLSPEAEESHFAAFDAEW